MCQIQCLCERKAFTLYWLAMKNKDHDFYMKKALVQANVAFRHGEVPIGAVVINKQGDIVARGYNKTERRRCQTAHAELIAIQSTCKKLGTWRLDDYSIYVTLEPCLMCFGLLHLSRIKGVFYGAHSNLFGFSLIDYKRNHSVISKYSKDMVIKSGLKEQQSIDMLRSFFRKARKGRSM